MFNYIPAQKGGTLMIVFGFIVTLAIVVTPLALSTNIGLLQAKTNGHTEQAYAEALSSKEVFARLYEDMAPTAKTEANIVALIQQVNNINALDAQASPVRDKDNKLIAVRFEGEAGTGNQARDSQVVYKIKGMYEQNELAPSIAPTSVPTPTPTPTPAPTSTPIPTPGTGMKVLLKNSTTPQNNKLFAACYVQPVNGQRLPTSHINNSFTDAQFQSWFNASTDYYLSQVSLTGTGANTFQDNRYNTAAALNNTVTASELSAKQSQAAIKHAGPVKIGGNTSQEITSDYVIQKDAEGYGIRTTGNLTFADIIKANVLINGVVEVGGNLSVREIKPGKTLTFKNDVYVRGDMTLGTGGTIDTIVVEGNLVIGGKLLTSNSLNKLIVKGDLIVAGDVTMGNTVQVWQVDRTLMVKGNFNTTNTIHRFQVGGDVAVKGSMTFHNTVSETSNGIEGAFSVGGSLKVFGSLDLKNTIYKLAVAGDFLVNSYLKFHNTLEGTVNVGGTLATGGDITFMNSVKKDITIGKNIITKSNLKFGDWSFIGGLKLGGYLLVYKDAYLHDLAKDWQTNSMAGFYVGGTTTFNPQYAQSWYTDGLDNGGTHERICIK
ncbi:hypothetical protein [Paenibacillus soyae]|uniref:Uncharacterized protein n=1 Tax=Paenibacillus soyae TaxID=2969249 RepID=A0A9X2MT70_9BACL|nr:hypothetical protein [Paenibacillus soyae]MCR2806516.1 hypothetical protein [Paenibacillus soyae]